MGTVKWSKADGGADCWDGGNSRLRPTATRSYIRAVCFRSEVLVQLLFPARQMFPTTAPAGALVCKHVSVVFTAHVRLRNNLPYTCTPGLSRLYRFSCKTKFLCQSTSPLCTSCLTSDVLVLDSKGLFFYKSNFLNENIKTLELFRILCDSFANFLLHHLSCGV